LNSNSKHPRHKLSISFCGKILLFWEKINQENLAKPLVPLFFFLNQQNFATLAKSKN
jgi:hypothetical protein